MKTEILKTTKSKLKDSQDENERLKTRIKELQVENKDLNAQLVEIESQLTDLLKENRELKMLARAWDLI